MNINKEVILSVTLGLILGGFLIVLARAGYENLINKFIVPILLVFLLIYTLINREKYRQKPNRWYCLSLSFIWPGLGQAIYAKQWKKFIILLAVIEGLPLLIVFSLLFLGMNLENINDLKKVIYPILLMIIVLIITTIVFIWNLFDAYNVGKNAEIKIFK